MIGLEQAREILDRLPYPGVTEDSRENRHKFLANLEAIENRIAGDTEAARDEGYSKGYDVGYWDDSYNGSGAR